MKLALARAMLMNADIMLLDEPTNHLDVTNVQVRAAGPGSWAAWAALTLPAHACACCCLPAQLLMPPSCSPLHPSPPARPRSG